MKTEQCKITNFVLCLIHVKIFFLSFSQVAFALKVLLFPGQLLHVHTRKQHCIVLYFE